MTASVKRHKHAEKIWGAILEEGDRQVAPHVFIGGSPVLLQKEDHRRILYNELAIIGGKSHSGSKRLLLTSRTGSQVGRRARQPEIVLDGAPNKRGGQRDDRVMNKKSGLVKRPYLPQEGCK